MTFMEDEEKSFQEDIEFPPSQAKGVRRFRMAAMDLDRTLLQSNHLLSNATCDYIQEIDRRGFIVSIATGRPACSVYQHAKSLNLPHALPVVCSNGARGLLCSVNSDGSVSSEELFYKPVPKYTAIKTIEIANQMGYVSLYMVDNEIFANPSLPQHFEITEKIKKAGSKLTYVDDNFEGALKIGLPSKQMVLCSNSERDEVINAFQKILSEDKRCLIHGRSPTIIRGNSKRSIEILHPDVNKGNGLKMICQYLKIPLSEVIAFGDGNNDIEFIQLAGHGAVMKNGVDLLKVVGDEIIEYNNDEDGVVRHLQKMDKQGFLRYDYFTDHSAV